MRDRNYIHHVLEETQVIEEEAIVENLEDTIDEYLQNTSHDIEAEENIGSSAYFQADAKNEGRKKTSWYKSTEDEMKYLVRLTSKGGSLSDDPLLSKQDISYLISAIVSCFGSKFIDNLTHAAKFVVGIGFLIEHTTYAGQHARVIPHWAMQALSYAMENGQKDLIIQVADEVSDLNGVDFLFQAFSSIINETPYPILHRAAVVAIGYLYDGSQEVPLEVNDILANMLSLKNKIFATSREMAYSRKDSDYLNFKEKNILDVRSRASKACVCLVKGGYQFNEELFALVSSLIEGPENQHERYFERISYQSETLEAKEGNYFKGRGVYLKDALKGGLLSEGDFGYLYKYIIEDQEKDCLEALLVACIRNGQCPPRSGEARYLSWGRLRPKTYTRNQMIRTLSQMLNKEGSNNKFIVATILCAFKNHQINVQAEDLANAYRTTIYHLSLSVEKNSTQSNRHQSFAMIALSQAIEQQLPGIQDHIGNFTDIFNDFRKELIQCFAIHIGQQITKSDAAYIPRVEASTVAVLKEIVNRSYGDIASAAFDAISVLVSNREHYVHLDGLNDFVDEQRILSFLNDSNRDVVIQAISLISRKVKDGKSLDGEIILALNNMYCDDNLGYTEANGITYIYAYLMKNHIDDEDSRINRTEFCYEVLQLILARGESFQDEEVYSFALFQYSRGIRNMPEEYHINNISGNFDRIVNLTNNVHINENVRDNYLKVVMNLLHQNVDLANANLINCLERLIHSEGRLADQAVSIISLLSKQLSSNQSVDLLDERLLDTMIMKLNGPNNQLSTNIAAVILSIVENRNESPRLPDSSYVKLAELLDDNVGFYFSQIILRKLVLEHEEVISDPLFMTLCLSGAGNYNEREISRFCSQLVLKLAKHIFVEEHVQQFNVLIVELLEFSMIDSFKLILKTIFQIPENIQNIISEEQRVQSAVAAAINLTGLSEEDRADIYQFMAHHPRLIRDIAKSHIRNDLQKGSVFLSSSCLRACQNYLITYQSDVSQDHRGFLAFILEQIAIVIDRKDLQSEVYAMLNSIVNTIEFEVIPEKIIYSCADFLYFRDFQGLEYGSHAEEEKKQEESEGEEVINDAISILGCIKERLDPNIKLALDNENKARRLLVNKRVHVNFCKTLEGNAANGIKITKTSMEYLIFFANKSKKFESHKLVMNVLLNAVKNGQEIMWASRLLLVNFLSADRHIFDVLEIFYIDDDYQEHYLGRDGELLRILQDKFIHSNDDVVLSKLVKVMKNFVIHGFSLNHNVLEKMISMLWAVNDDETKEAIVLMFAVLKDDPEGFVDSYLEVVEPLVYLLKSHVAKGVGIKIANLLCKDELYRKLKGRDKVFVSDMNRLFAFYNDDKKSKLNALNCMQEIDFDSNNANGNMQSLNRVGLDIVRDAFFDDDEDLRIEALKTLANSNIRLSIFSDEIVEKLISILHEQVETAPLLLAMKCLIENFECVHNRSFHRLFGLVKRLTYLLKKHFENDELKAALLEIIRLIRSHMLNHLEHSEELDHSDLEDIESCANLCGAILAYEGVGSEGVSLNNLRVLVEGDWMSAEECLASIENYSVSVEWLELMILLIRKGCECKKKLVNRVNSASSNLSQPVVVKFHYYNLLSCLLLRGESYHVSRTLLRTIVEDLQSYDDEFRHYGLSLLSLQNHVKLPEAILNELTDMYAIEDEPDFKILFKQFDGFEELIDSNCRDLFLYYPEEHRIKIATVLYLTLYDNLNKSRATENLRTVLDIFYYLRTDANILPSQILLSDTMDDLAFNACEHWFLYHLTKIGCVDVDPSLVGEIVSLIRLTNLSPEILVQMIGHNFDVANQARELQHLKEMLEFFNDKRDDRLYSIFEHSLLNTQNMPAQKKLNVEWLHHVSRAFFFMGKCGYLPESMEDENIFNETLLACELISQLIMNDWKLEDLIFIYDLLSSHINLIEMDGNREVLDVFEILINYKIKPSEKNKLFQFVNQEMPSAFDRAAIRKNAYSKLFHRYAVKKHFQLVARDKTVNELVDEFSSLNNEDPNISTNITKILANKFHVINSGKMGSMILQVDLPVNQWEVSQFRGWARNFASHNLTISNENAVEVFSVMTHAIQYYTSLLNDGKGYKLRPAQLLAVMSLLFNVNNQPMRLGEMATGEGKSTVIAVVAAIKALENRSVDVIVSSPVLAARDAKEFSPFFDLFNLNTSHNGDGYAHNNQKKMKTCYGDDVKIVYGTPSQFQFDILRHEFKQYNTRGNRRLDYAIVDEADNIMLDQATSVARLSDTIPGFDQLQWLYLFIWEYLSKKNIPEEDIEASREELKSEMVCVIENILSQEGASEELETKGGDDAFSNVDLVDDVKNKYILFDEIRDKYSEINHHMQARDAAQDAELKLLLPQHLMSFVKFQLPHWIDNAIYTMYYLKLNRDYVVRRDQNNHSVITPIDYLNTGTTLENTQWSDGMHQFAQIKENIELTYEGLTTNFLSNFSFFHRYDSLIGLTGTLGNAQIRNFLSDIYKTSNGKLQTLTVPQYREKRFVDFKPSLLANKKAWLNRIECCAQRQLNYGRAVLVICESIEDVEEVYKKLTKGHRYHHKVKKYARSDEINQGVLEREIEVGHVIVATNLAGRGTDIKPSANVKKNGGLHVIVTSLSINDRVCQQAYGRTSRSGAPGTAEVVVNREALPSEIKNTISWRSLSEERNNFEMIYLERLIGNQIDAIRRNEQLFQRFCELNKSVHEILSAKNYEFKYSITVRIMALIERWGLWFKQSEGLEDVDNEFNNFERVILEDLENDKLIKNPCYFLREANYIIAHLDSWYHTLVQLNRAGRFCNKIISICDQVNDPLFFGTAASIKGYAMLRKDLNKNKVDGKELFEESISYIGNINLPQMHVMQSLLSNNSEAKTELLSQIGGKIAILNSAISSQKEIVNIVDKSRKLVDLILHSRNENIDSKSKLTIDEAGSYIEENTSADRVSLMFHDLRMAYDLASTVRNDPVKLMSIANEAGAAQAVNIVFSEISVSHCQQLLDKISCIENVKDYLPKILFNEKHISLDEDLLLKISSMNSLEVGAKFEKITIDCFLDEEKARSIVAKVKNRFRSSKSRLDGSVRVSLSGVINIRGVDGRDLVPILTAIMSEHRNIRLDHSDEKKDDETEMLVPQCEIRHSVQLNNVKDNSELKIIAKPSEFCNLTLVIKGDLVQEEQVYNLFKVLGSCMDDAVIRLPKIPRNIALSVLRNFSCEVYEEELISLNARNISSVFINSEQHKEIDLLILNGFQYLFELEERRPVQVYTLLVLGSVLVAEATAGALLTTFTLGFGASVGLGLMIESASDLIQMIQVGVSREHNWTAYAAQKSASLILLLATAGLSSIQAAKAARSARSARVAGGVVEETGGTTTQRMVLVEALQESCEIGGLNSSKGLFMANAMPVISGAGKKIVGKLAYHTITPEVFKATCMAVRRNVESHVAHWQKGLSPNIAYIFACAEMAGINQYDHRIQREIQAMISGIIRSNSNQFGNMANTAYLFSNDNQITDLVEDCLFAIGDYLNGSSTYNIKHVMEHYLEECQDVEVADSIRMNLTHIERVLKRRSVIIHNNELNQNINFENAIDAFETKGDEEDFAEHIYAQDLFKHRNALKYRSHILSLLECLYDKIYLEGRQQTKLNIQKFVDIISTSIVDILTQKIMEVYEKSIRAASSFVINLGSSVGDTVNSGPTDMINDTLGLPNSTFIITTQEFLMSLVPNEVLLIPALFGSKETRLDYFSVILQDMACSLYLDDCKFKPNSPLSIARMQIMRDGVLHFNPLHRQLERYADEAQEEKMNHNLGPSFADMDGIVEDIFQLLDELSSFLSLEIFDRPLNYIDKPLELYQLVIDIRKKYENLSPSEYPEYLFQIVKNSYFWDRLKEVLANIENAKLALDKIKGESRSRICMYPFPKYFKDEVCKNEGLVKNDVHLLLSNTFQSNVFINNLSLLLPFFDEKITREMDERHVHVAQVTFILRLLAVQICYDNDEKLEAPFVAAYIKFLSVRGRLKRRLINTLSDHLNSPLKKLTNNKLKSFKTLADKIDFNLLYAFNALSDMVMSIDDLDIIQKRKLYQKINDFLLELDASQFFILLLEFIHTSEEAYAIFVAHQEAIGKTLGNLVNLLRQKADILYAYVKGDLNRDIAKAAFRFSPINTVLFILLGHKDLLEDVAEVALFYIALKKDVKNACKVLLSSPNNIYHLGDHLTSLLVGLGSSFLRSYDIPVTFSAIKDANNMFSMSIRYIIGILFLQFSMLTALVSDLRAHVLTSEYRLKPKLSHHEFLNVVPSVVNTLAIMYMCFFPVHYFVYLLIISSGFSFFRQQSEPSHASFKDVYATFFTVNSYDEFKDEEDLFGPLNV